MGLARMLMNGCCSAWRNAARNAVSLYKNECGAGTAHAVLRTTQAGLQVEILRADHGAFACLGIGGRASVLG